MNFLFFLFIFILSKFTQNVIITLPDYHPEKGSKIRVNGLDAFDLYTVQLVTIQCRATRDSCQQDYNHLHIYAKMHGEKFRFKVVQVNKETEEKICLDSPNFDDGRELKKLNIELPSHYKTKKGVKVNLAKIDSIEIINSKNDEIEGSMTLDPGMRDIIKRSISAVEPEYNCISPPERTIIGDFSEYCPGFAGTVSIYNSMTISISDFKIVTEEMQYDVDAFRGTFYAKFKTNSGSKKRFLVDNVDCRIGRLSQDFDHQSFNIDHSVEYLEIIGIQINGKVACELNITKNFDLSSIERGVFNCLDLYSETLFICGHLPSIDNGEYALSDGNDLGSTVSFTCNNGYFLSPEGFTMDCVKRDGEAVWSSKEKPECKEIQYKCSQSSCHSRGTCTETDEDTGVTCKCEGNFYGRYCEKHINPCEINPCGSHGDCMPKNDFNDYECECYDPYYGKYCELGGAKVPEEINIESYRAPCNSFKEFQIYIYMYKDVVSSDVHKDGTSVHISCKYGTNGKYSDMEYKCDNGHWVVVTDKSHNLHSLIDLQCSTEKISGRCTLPKIYHGVFDTKEESILVGEYVPIKCNHGFRQTVKGALCKENGELSLKSPVCIAESEHLNVENRAGRGFGKDTHVIYIAVFVSVIPIFY